MRSARGCRVLVFVLGLAAITSCTLLVDTSGLSRGGDPPAAIDASDAHAPDAGALPDATVDPDGASTESACSATIADSFDDGPLGARWTIAMTGGLVPSLDSNDVVSPPNALLVTIPAQGAGNAILSKKVSPSKTMCLQVSLKADDFLDLARLEGIKGNYRLTINRGSGTLNVIEGYYAGPTDPGISRSFGLPFVRGWQRVRLEASFPVGAGRGMLHVLVDGVEALATTIGGDAYDLSVDTCEVGVLYAQSAAAARSARLDNVTCGLR